jgi:Domain of unknown function (DUF397)
MATQQTDVSDLAVRVGAQQQWAPGTVKDGVDDRVELARVDAAAQIAVRDARHPTGPALLFDLPGWQALVGGTPPDLVDLRSIELPPTN